MVEVKIPQPPSPTHPIPPTGGGFWVPYPFSLGKSLPQLISSCNHHKENLRIQEQALVMQVQAEGGASWKAQGAQGCASPLPSLALEGTQACAQDG